MRENMREGPPSGGGESALSASTLLREITTLRGRLTELEDDTKSSVCDDQNDLSNMLRKELSKVEQDKANLEKEFMNQLSVLARENHNIVSSLQSKLTEKEKQNTTLTSLLKSSNEQNDQESVAANDEALKMLGAQVAAERETHTKEMGQIKEAHLKEIDQMKENLASADLEIADSRREMDHLHEEVVDVSSHRQSLVEELTAAKLNLGREILTSKSLRTQLSASEKTAEQLRREMAEKDVYIDEKNLLLGEMNDSIIAEEAHKEMLMSEVTHLRKNLVKEEETISSLQARVHDLLETPRHSNSTSTPTRQKGPLTVEIEPPITPAEKVQLEDGVTKLEERLQRLQSKFSEKDKTIDNLAASLSEERKLSKKLTTEVHRLKDKSTDTDTPIEQRIANEKRKTHNLNNSSAEIDFIRKQNKILNDEVKTLRLKANGNVVHVPRSNSPDHRNRNSRSPSPQPRAALPSPMTPPKVTRKAAIRGPTSPRTPVSNIVAKFEQRIWQKTPTPSSGAGDDEPTALDAVDARRELDLEREMVADLQEKLGNERALVEILRADLMNVSSQAKSSTNLELKLEKKLAKSEKEIEILRAMVDEYQDRQVELEMEIQKADIDRRLQEREIERLQSEVVYATDQAAMQDEKKSEEVDNNEELVRLRDQVAALQPELSRTFAEIDKLQCEVDQLRVALRSEQLASIASLQLARKAVADDEASCVSAKDQKSYESELNHLKVELTKTQMAKAEREMEYMVSIKELENEIGVLEVEAEEELNEKQKELDGLINSLSAKERDIARLEHEKTQICSIQNASFSRKDDTEDLQAELMETIAKTTAQAREIQSLKMKIEDYEARKGELEKKVQDRLRELEDELDSTVLSSQSQVISKDFDDLKSENNKLRESVRSVVVERRRLQERLDALVSDKSSSKSVTVLRDRNAALKKEVEKLTKRLRKMEASITRCAV
jgi:chromosome segregation ATPase